MHTPQVLGDSKGCPPGAVTTKLANLLPFIRRWQAVQAITEGLPPTVGNGGMEYAGYRSPRLCYLGLDEV